MCDKHITGLARDGNGEDQAMASHHSPFPTIHTKSKGNDTIGAFPETLVNCCSLQSTRWPPDISDSSVDAKKRRRQKTTEMTKRSRHHHNE
jgi:hypothetical protein